MKTIPSNVRPLAPYGNLLKKMFSDHFPTQKLGKSSCGRLIYLHNMTFCLHALQHFRRGAVCFWGAVVWHSGWGVDNVMSGTHHLTHQSHGIFCNVFTLANILSLKFLLNCHIFNALTSHDPLTKRHDVIFLFKQLWEHHPLFQISWKNAIWWYSCHFPSERLPCHASPDKNAIWWYPYHVPIRNTVKQLWEHPLSQVFWKNAIWWHPYHFPIKKHCQTTVGTHPYHKPPEKMLSNDAHITFHVTWPKYSQTYVGNHSCLPNKENISKMYKYFQNTIQTEFTCLIWKLAILPNKANVSNMCKESPAFQKWQSGCGKLDL